MVRVLIKSQHVHDKLSRDYGLEVIMALKFKSIKTNRDSTISNDTIESMYIKPL